MTTRINIVALVMFFVTTICGQGLFAANQQAGEIKDMPMGQSAEEGVSLLPEDVDDVDDDGLFGTEGGYFHPYVSLVFEYTDNLYNLDEKFEDGEVENLLTVLSPGIWFALPRKKIIPISINPNNSSPGGLQLQFEDYEGTDRYEAYALGGLDLKYYSEDNSDLNKTDGLVEGMFRYNMRGGLALQLVDRYTHGEDELEAGSLTRGQNRGFDSNLFMAIADWDITEKFRVKADYINFVLGYDEELNRFLDRVDNGFDLYGYFNYSLKTSFFLEYKLIDAAYDDRTQVDNTSHFLYGGIKWDTTEKLALLLKVGYQKKKFEHVDLGQSDFEGFVYDLQFTYRYSEKTSFKLDTYRTNEETDNFLAYDQTVLGANFTYNQKFSEKWSGSLGIGYDYAQYSNFDIVVEKDRDDKSFSIRPAVEYLFREWLMLELAYEYDTRESTVDLFDYDTNTVMLSINFAL